MIHVYHVVGLSGIGGVQKNFSDYSRVSIGREDIAHTVFTIGEPDKSYINCYKHYNIKKLKSLFRLIKGISSNRVIVHFYNNFGSKKLFILLCVIPSNNLVIHERGASWNIDRNKKYRYHFIYKKVTKVICNSYASKAMLLKKFNLPGEKMVVIYNGVDLNNTGLNVATKRFDTFTVGFIGRIDNPKGAHIIVSLANIASSLNHKIDFLIAGDGPLEKIIKRSSANLTNISFLGRVHDPYSFISSIDILVVPSIREPLGNVILEAGLCKKAVIASYIDGIPEINTNNKSGILVEPSDPIDPFFVDKNLKTLPNFVVSPKTMELIEPLQLSAKDIYEKIIFLINNQKIMTDLGKSLNKTVKDKFCLNRYERELYSLYKSIQKQK